MEAAMFQKIATFWDTGARCASRPAALAHANDNRINARGAVASGRPILTCHWRSAAGGKLECYWEIETVAAGAAEEPDGRWTISRVA
jgi:hypothetical protein